ncbi:hypothetical protein BCAR13_700018 [Paraburkholderia caribensis]|nr:hypothetical protein BCAR13_700018 [Paraburkholderia caribensis]
MTVSTTTQVKSRHATGRDSVARVAALLPAADCGAREGSAAPDASARLSASAACRGSGPASAGLAEERASGMSVSMEAVIHSTHRTGAFRVAFCRFGSASRKNRESFPGMTCLCYATLQSPAKRHGDRHAQFASASPTQG